LLLRDTEHKTERSSIQGTESAQLSCNRGCVAPADVMPPSLDGALKVPNSSKRRKTIYRFMQIPLCRALSAPVVEEELMVRRVCVVVEEELMVRRCCAPAVTRYSALSAPRIQLLQFVSQGETREMMSRSGRTINERCDVI